MKKAITLAAALATLSYSDPRPGPERRGLGHVVSQSGGKEPQMLTLRPPSAKRVRNRRKRGWR